MNHIPDQFEGGDWAGNVYQDSGCPSTCVGMFYCFISTVLANVTDDVWNIDFVNNNPASFKDAYFDFASIRTYTAAEDPFAPQKNLKRHHHRRSFNNEF
jgi:hypothetical protein